jgi:hypothetical protein
MLRRKRARAARLRVAAFLLAAVAGTAPARAADTPARGEVRDPYYGSSLFEFYREHYFSALTELMVAQHFDRLSHQRDDAEILRGGLYLSYGLHREASRIFARLIDAGATPAVRDRAWFYLAKIRYQRGLIADAEEALGRIGDTLPPDLEEGRALLQGNLLMARGAFENAAELLKKIPSKGPKGSYVRYNLGVALIKSGSVARGSELLDEIGVQDFNSEELRALRDKANVALGFASLQGHDPERARVYLARVRLNGMLADKALLGFGWASDALGQAKDALVPWSELASRDTSDAAVLEAKLAMPYALAKLGANAQALEQYGKALASYGDEAAHLDESMEAVRSGKLFDALVAGNPGQEMGWFWNIEKLPPMPHPGHFAQLFALHEFQEAFKSYRDLEFLAQNLRAWAASLDAMQDMLDNRRRAFSEKLPAAQAGARGTQIEALEARRDALNEELSAAANQGDGAALADGREAADQQRIARAEAIIAQLPMDEDRLLASERLRRVAGALTWQLAQAYPERLWNARKDLTQLSGALQIARAADAQLARAQREQPARFESMGARIVALRARVQAMQPVIARLVDQQRAEIAQMTIAALEQQKEELGDFSNQARFAIAQIYDRASSAQEESRARKP